MIRVQQRASQGASMKTGSSTSFITAIGIRDRHRAASPISPHCIREGGRGFRSNCGRYFTLPGQKFGRTIRRDPDVIQVRSFTPWTRRRRAALVASYGTATLRTRAKRHGLETAPAHGAWTTLGQSVPIGLTALGCMVCTALERATGVAVGARNSGLRRRRKGEGPWLQCKGPLASGQVLL